MKERPILFSGPMVQAILRDDSPKTQTRRPMRPQPFGVMRMAGTWYPSEESKKARHYASEGHFRSGVALDFCPYGQPSDRLWVRETWGSMEADHPLSIGGRVARPGDTIIYRADPGKDYQWGPGRPSQGSFVWRPSIFMPRWASRITLEITGVRIERVRDINDADISAEGILGDSYLEEIGSTQRDPRSARIYFMEIWDSINSERGFGWDSNPWVWVIEFKRTTAHGKADL